MAPEAITFKMVSSSMPEPVTMMRRPGRLALSVAIRSNRFCPLQLTSKTTSMSARVARSETDSAISSKPDSESNRARNPTRRSGSVSTTATRISGFLATAAFMNSSQAFCRKHSRTSQKLRITRVTPVSGLWEQIPESRSRSQHCTGRQAIGSERRVPRNGRHPHKSYFCPSHEASCISPVCSYVPALLKV